MITLTEAKVGMADKVDQMVVDEFRRDSFLLDRLSFDNAVSPGTGGSTLTYGYMQLKTPSTAGRRDINTEYTANEAKREKKTADLDIFGGSFKVDRVIQNTSGAVNEIEFQLREKIKAASNLFHNAVINGNTAGGKGYTQAKFDGLRKLVAGSSTEASASGINLSDVENIDKYRDSFVLKLNKWLGLFAEKPDMLMMNSTMLSVMKYIGQKMGYYSRDKNDFGQTVETYDNIILMDAGRYYNGTAEEDCIATGTDDGLSSIIGVKFGTNAFHGISPTQAAAIINTYLPDMSAPGAVKTGEVELVAGVVLKNSKMAGMLKDIQIAPTA